MAELHDPAAPREHDSTAHAPGHGHDHGDHDHATDCEAALAEIYTYLDGELTAEKRVLIARHLEGCNPCIEAYDFEAELRMVISRRCRDEVPESLRIRIAEQLTLLARTDDPSVGDEGTAADPA